MTAEKFTVKNVSLPRTSWGAFILDRKISSSLSSENKVQTFFYLKKKKKQVKGCLLSASYYLKANIQLLQPREFQIQDHQKHSWLSQVQSRHRPCAGDDLWVGDRSADFKLCWWVEPQ